MKFEFEYKSKLLYLQYVQFDILSSIQLLLFWWTDLKFKWLYICVVFRADSGPVGQIVANTESIETV